MSKNISKYTEKTRHAFFVGLLEGGRLDLVDDLISTEYNVLDRKDPRFAKLFLNSSKFDPVEKDRLYLIKLLEIVKFCMGHINELDINFNSEPFRLTKFFIESMAKYRGITHLNDKEEVFRKYKINAGKNFMPLIEATLKGLCARKSSQDAIDFVKLVCPGKKNTIRLKLTQVKSIISNYVNPADAINSLRLLFEYCDEYKDYLVIACLAIGDRNFLEELPVCTNDIIDANAAMNRCLSL